MSAGTITLENNSNAVAGIDTSFTTELAAGDFIVVTTGGVTYTLPVKSIESDTALTLARNYNGPAVTAGAWTAMPRDTLNRISAQIAADTAYIIRQRVLEVDNWYQLLEVNGDVTIKMADGSSYTGPSWLKLIDAMNNPTWALAKSKNLSDLEDRDEAWMNIRPTGPTPLAADPVADGDSATMGWVKLFVAALRSIASAWSVIITLASTPANSTTVKGGKLRSVLQIGDNEYAAAELQISVTTNSTGAKTVTTEVVSQNSTSGTNVTTTYQFPSAGGTLLGSGDIGTSGAKLPLLNTANTWGATQTIKSPMVVAADGPASPVSGQLINSPVLRMRVNGRGANSDAMGEVGDIFLQEKVGTYVALTFNISAFSDNKFWSMNASTGETFSPLGTLAVQGSDVRIKYNFTPPKIGAWKRVEAIGICEYMYNGSTIPQRGFLAQQMGEVDEMYVFESSVSTTKDADGNEFNILNVNDRAVMADVITVIQALQQKVTDLEKMMADMKASGT